MSTKPASKKSSEPTNLSISALLGVMQVLPGESEEVYRRGLLAAIAELGAKTPLQVYLAEKMFECLWWMRRYEEQKRAALIDAMADLLVPKRVLGVSPLKAIALDAMFTDQPSKEFLKLMDDGNYSLESLRQQAFMDKRGYLKMLDEQLALKAKTLAGFQASYEVLVNRKLNAERMQLSNDLLRRDLGAIDLEALPHDQPQKTAGQ